MKKLLAGLSAVPLSSLALGACASGGAAPSATSSEATAADPLVLRLAHNLGDGHPTSQALRDFVDAVEEGSGGRIVIEVYGGGQLGDEPHVLGQLREGIVDITRVSSPGLVSAEPGYHTFGLPYVFEDEEDFYRVMDSPEMADYFEASADAGFVGLTYYTSGARSFYTVDTPIRTPEDLRGLKIRVQDMRSQTELMDAVNGTPVVMAFGDQYTALQTGLIDGAESNETVLTDSAHGEVAKAFSLTEHTRIPDMLVISSDTWERLAPADQDLLREAARQSTEDHKVLWEESIEQAVAESEEMGVEFIDDVDLEAFQEATGPLVDQYAEEFPEVAELLSVIEAARE